MVAPKAGPKDKSCSECGAELMLGSARCPLCGTQREVSEVEVYQADLRRLREQLDAIRAENGEAS